MTCRMCLLISNPSEGFLMHMPKCLLQQAVSGTPLQVQQAARLARNEKELVEPCAIVECHGLVSSGEKL